MESSQKCSLLMINDYHVHLILGDGGQSKVYLVEKDGKFFAAKVFKGINAYSNEISALSLVNSPKIVSFIQGFSDATLFYKDSSSEIKPVGILEFAGRGDLFQMIQQTKKLHHIPPHICRAKFIEILDALQETHSKGFAHRDIKPQNFVFDSKYHLKMTDFGLAKRLEGQNGDGRLYSKVGTAQYWAPQIFMGSYEGVQSDIFSIGMILYIMLFSTVPFRSSRFNDEFYKYFKDGKVEESNKFWEKKTKNKNHISGELKQLFRLIFQNDPKKRPTISQIRNCSWVKNGRIGTEQEIFEHFSKKHKILIENNVTRGQILTLTEREQEKKSLI